MQGIVQRRASDINARLRLSINGAYGGAGGDAMAATDRTGRTNMLQERLDEVLVMELLKDGGRNYLTLSVRSLYKHVLAAITGPSDVDLPMRTIPETTPHQSTPRSANERSGPTPKKQQQQHQQPSEQQQAFPPSLDLPGAAALMGSLNTPGSSTVGDQPQQEQETEITFFTENEEPTPLISDSTPLPSSISEIPTAQERATQPPLPPLTPSMALRGMASPSSSAKKTIDLPPAPPPTGRMRNRSKSVSLSSAGGGLLSSAQEEITYRERLGGYLHPRDMRRLVTPFSASNEPEIMVRRHVMLLNFDPLRAIILRDRLLILIPDGADSMLVDLERRVRGGSKELEAAIFGMDSTHHHDPISGGSGHYETAPSNDNSATSGDDNSVPRTGSFFSRVWNYRRTSSLDSNSERDGAAAVVDYLNNSEHALKKPTSAENLRTMKKGKSNPHSRDLDSPHQPGKKITAPPEENDNHQSSEHKSEWDDLQGKEWIQLPFELQCADAVLHTVTHMLTDDTDELQAACLGYIEGIIGGRVSNDFKGEDPLTIIRAVKDSVREMTARVKSFVKSMNDTLDDYEDMALMNLSRLLTHPERFIQPVPAEVLEEESDEPELILESYLQHAMSLMNVLDLIQGQIDTAAELIDQKLDAARNKILLANTIITMVALCVQLATMVAGYFGMNLINHLEDSENAFMKVTFWSIAIMVAFFFALMAIMSQTGTLPGWGSISGGGF